MIQENSTGKLKTDDESGETGAISLSIIKLNSQGALLPGVGSLVQRDLYN